MAWGRLSMIILQRLPQSGWRRASLTGAMIFSLALWLMSATACNWMTLSYNSSGVKLYQQGQYAIASDHFQKAIRADPNHPDAYYNLAATYHQLGRLNQRADQLDQAELFYRQCLQKHPNHRDGHRGLAVLLAQRSRSEEAFSLLEDWVARVPQSPDPKIELARLTEEFGDDEAAKQYLFDALQIEPRDPRALAALGKIRERAGEAGQALANYNRSLQSNPHQPELARRVTDLSVRMSASGGNPAPNGTRIVNTPANPVR